MPLPRIRVILAGGAVVPVRSIYGHMEPYAVIIPDSHPGGVPWAQGGRGTEVRGDIMNARRNETMIESDNQWHISTNY